MSKIIKVYGRVQGVYFRASTKTKADELGIKGIVRNEKDGSVYIEADGKEEDMKKFIEWCHRGPDRASVNKVEISEGENKSYQKFEVTR